MSNFIKIGHIAEKNGVDAIIIHGRYGNQMYQGENDLVAIRDIKKELTIPVIANGNVIDKKTYEEMKKFTLCDGVMIGRAALSNPQILSDICSFSPIYTTQFGLIDRYIELGMSNNQYIDFNTFKKSLLPIIRLAVPDNLKLQIKIFKTNCYEDLLKIWISFVNENEKKKFAKNIRKLQ